MAELRHIIVTDPDALVDCCAHLRESRRFGLDTEFIGERSYHPELCLVQVATDAALYLIDPFALESLDPFWSVAIDPANEVVVHAGREEVRLCHLWSGQTPGNLFDLQIAAGLTGFAYPLGHAALVSHVLGVKLPKGETLTEWNKRPLTRAQVQYAFDDVRYMLPIWRELNKRLETMGRQEWAAEEFGRLRDQATPNAEGLSVSVDKWRRIKGASALDRRRLAILRELFFWRERMAAASNRPPRTIVRDDLLIEIARRSPKTVKDLSPIRGLAKRHLDGIFSAMETARELSSDLWPPLTERDQDPPQVALAVNLLSAALASLSTQKRVAANLVATTADLKSLVRARRDDGLPPGRTLLLQGWRSEHFLPELVKILNGDAALRLADVRGDMPIEVLPMSSFVRSNQSR